MLRDIEAAKNLEQLRALPGKYNPEFNAIGMKPGADDNVTKAYSSKAKFLKESGQTAPPTPASTPPSARPATPASAPAPAKQAPAPAPSSDIEQKREQVRIWLNENPPMIPQDVLQIVGKTCFEELDDNDIERIHEIATKLISG